MRGRDRMGLPAGPMAVVGSGLMLLAVAGAVGIGRLTETQETPSAIPVAQDLPAPPLVFMSLSGEQLSLAHYRGQVVLINLWATRCPPCRAEMPMLADAARDYAAQGLTILAVNQGESSERVRDFASRRGIDLIMGLDPHEQASSLLPTTALPSSTIVNKQGQVRLAWFGAVDRADLDEALLRVLASGGVQ
jgi:cytochrome c biogenesis protein CcmG/thiol:disulfide interchange protein DsbE